MLHHTLKQVPSLFPGIKLCPLTERDVTEWLVPLMSHNASHLVHLDSPNDRYGDVEDLCTAVALARRSYPIRYRISVNGRPAGIVKIGRLCTNNYELGYWIDRAKCGEGIAPKATATLALHVVTHAPAAQLIICIKKRNQPSHRAARKTLALLQERSENGSLTCDIAPHQSNEGYMIYRLRYHRGV